jgi:hypothetical protein
MYFVYWLLAVVEDGALPFEAYWLRDAPPV